MIQNLVNRAVNAILGFLLAAFKSTDPNRPLPPPAPFPVGTPPTPPPLPPTVLPPPTPLPPATPPAVVDALKWYAAVHAFMTKWDKKFIPPKFGADFQCVALVNEWTSEAWGVYWPRLSAAGDFVGYRIPGFTFIANTPTNNPYPGDIVEWHKSPTLPWGHISVCLSATTMQLQTFDQNWPLHSPAHQQGHTYAGVSGWHHKI